MMSKGINKMYI